MHDFQMLKTCALSWSYVIAIPQGVQDATIIPDPQHPIGRGDPVGVCLLGVAEERVRDPDFANHVAV